MKIILLCFWISVGLSLCGQSSSIHPPGIYTEVAGSGYDLADKGFLYNTLNVGAIFRIPANFTTGFGAHYLEDDRHFYRDISGDELFEGGYLAGSTVVFQKHGNGQHSLFLRDTLNTPFLILLNESLEQTARIDGPNFDIHGICMLEDGSVAYAVNVMDTVVFHNPPAVVDEREWITLGQDIVLYDPQDSSSETVFDWFDNIPPFFVIPEYLYEGNFGGTDFIDWGHFNWIEQDWDGHYLISWRHLGICKVHAETGEVIWWAGLPQGLAQANGIPELTCIQGDCRTRLQHHFKPLEGHPGQYTLFDNGDIYRDSSRALFLQIDENAGTIAVTKDFWFEYAPFMGSVDVLSDGLVLVNVPQLGGIGAQQFIQWNSSGVLVDSIQPYLPDMGSLIYLCDSTGEFLGLYRTDSLNYIYQAQFADMGGWPEIVCTDNTLTVTGLDAETAAGTDWSSENGFIEDQEAITPADDVYTASFEYGVAVGFTDQFVVSSCNITAVESDRTVRSVLYPNPSHGKGLFVRDYIGRIRISDSCGRKVWAGNTASDGRIPTELEPGVYFVSGQGWTTRIIVF